MRWEKPLDAADLDEIELRGMSREELEALLERVNELHDRLDGEEPEDDGEDGEDGEYEDGFSTVSEAQNGTEALQGFIFLSNFS